jgi:hypothetical protein
MLARLFQRGVDNCQAVIVGHRMDIGDSENALQFVIRHLHRTRTLGSARCGLWKRGGYCCVEGHVALYLLHHLVDMAIQNGNRAKPLQIREGLFAIRGSSSPLEINRP